MGLYKTETDIGTAQGWMGFSGEDASTYINMQVFVAGYPSYTPLEMYTNTGTITGLYGDNRLKVSADTDNGMSGCPYFSSDHYVRAIHHGGLSDCNVGTFITPELFYLLRQAKQDGISRYS